MTNTVNEELDAAESLVRWFWEQGGNNRTHPHQLGTEWIIRAHDAASLLTAANNVENTQRGGLAVWGPSQTGKSTLLSQFLDASESPDSAISWDPAEPFRFSTGKDDQYNHISALNPYNLGSDASSCVSRLHIPTDPVDEAFPVELTLGARQEILHAIAAGYLLECDTTLDDGTERFWDKDSFETLILENQGGGVLDRDAFELASEAALIVSRLINDGHQRYRNLRTYWDGGLRKLWLRSAKNYQKTLDAVTNLLWDGQSGLTDLFHKLDAARKSYEIKFSDRRIKASLAFTRDILNIDSFAQYADDDTDSSDILGIRYDEKSDEIRIGGGSGDTLFSTMTDYGLFQALVWMVDVPLREDFLKQKPPEVHALLSEADIYDIPGLGLPEKGTDEFSLRSAKLGSTTLKELLSKVLKRGKTSSIVTRFALERRFIGVLILLLSKAAPPKLDQLKSGINAIWAGFDPGRENRDTPKVSTFVCMTFLAQLFNDWAGYKFEKGDIKRRLENHLGGLGLLSDPRMVTWFMSNYPHLNPGKFSSDLSDEDREAIVDAFEQDSWFKDRFISTESKASLRLAADPEDGGVLNLLGAMRSGLNPSLRSNFVSESMTESQTGIDRLIREALPQREASGALTREALEALKAGIDNKLSSSGGITGSLSGIGRDILALTTVRDTDLDRLPSSWRVETDLTGYAKKQLHDWASDSERIDVLLNYGVTERQARLIMTSLYADIDWVSLGQWMANLVPQNCTPIMARNLRRHVAILLGNCINGHQQTLRRSTPAQSDNLADCQRRFDAWRSGHNAQVSPHYELVINPFIDRLARLSDNIPSDDWQTQPGDDQIETIANMRFG